MSFAINRSLKFYVARLMIAGLCLASSGSLFAHDTWIQTNVAKVTPGEVVHVDLMLGNHGNEHRDFELASKIGIEKVSFDLITPDGNKQDLKSRVADIGHAAKEGFWSVRQIATQPGTYVAAQSLDTLHGTTRAYRNAKCYFQVGEKAGGVDPMKPLGQPIELVPQSSPATAKAGEPITVQVLLKGKPLADATMSFIPRGAELAADFDPNFERKTDAAGKATFTPPEANYYLIVVHHAADDEMGEKYDRSHYAATLTLNIAR
ncbi:MAG: DUF4198 domain-containing protein [Planctomyces sp.]|nr:DUF4198 domain-containing protein [Planctomyces sp.]